MSVTFKVQCYDGMKVGQILSIGWEGYDAEHVTVIGFGSVAIVAATQEAREDRDGDFGIGRHACDLRKGAERGRCGTTAFGDAARTRLHDTLD